MYNGTTSLENVNQFLTKLTTYLFNKSAILSLGIYPKEKKTDVHRKACTRNTTA